MGPSRREFVAMLLGAPLAAACGGGGARTIEGSLVETGMGRGHAMRDLRAIPAVPDGRWRRTGVIVIGGGVAGLSAAWWLRRNGRTDVTVVELDDVVGGTARGGASSVTPYPWGAHYVVAPRADEAAMVALFEEQGAIEGHDAHGDPIIDEALRCRDPDERIWYRGRWADGLYLSAGASAEDLAQLARFDAAIDQWATWRDAAGRPAFTVPVSACSTDPTATALDRESFGAWLDRQGLTSERLRWMTDYACRDDYDLLAADTSAWAGIYYFAARRRAPGSSRAVVTWPDGNAHLIAHLASKVGPIETKLAVVDVRAVAGGVEVIALADDGPVGIRAEHAVVAVPRHVARHIVATRREAGGVLPDCGAWAVANVHLRDRPRERPGDAPPAWDNVIRDSPSLGYVSATHQRGRDVGPTVWTWYYPFPEDGAVVRKRLAGAGHGEWAATVVADLARVHRDLPDLVTRVDVAFWGHGMVRPRVGAMFDLTRMSAAAPIGAIHFAHTDLSGMALFEEALDHGVRAAREILAS
ncbi:MAG: FAD-dependent oxidoreductase [Deltaproteobacteria bacterium]|nr:FAD-dependent oxidoreductase [Deltaproteobacteria bacterium]